MKKKLSLVLVLVLTLSVFAACGKNSDTNEPDKTGEPNNTQVEEPTGNNTPDETPSHAENDNNSSKTDKKTTSDVPSAAVPAPSDNKDVVTEDNAPDVYLVIDSEDNAASVSYHLKGCNLLKDGESQKIAWEMIKTLGFRQCPQCNPPQYKGYIE